MKIQLRDNPIKPQCSLFLEESEGAIYLMAEDAKGEPWFLLRFDPETGRARRCSHVPRTLGLELGARGRLEIHDD